MCGKRTSSQIHYYTCTSCLSLIPTTCKVGHDSQQFMIIFRDFKRHPSIACRQNSDNQMIAGIKKHVEK